MDRVYVIMCHYDDAYEIGVKVYGCFNVGFFTDEQDCLDAAEKLAKKEVSKYDDDSYYSAWFGFIPERNEFYAEVFDEIRDRRDYTVSFRCECIEAHKEED